MSKVLRKGPSLQQVNTALKELANRVRKLEKEEIAVGLGVFVVGVVTGLAIGKHRD